MAILQHIKRWWYTTVNPPKQQPTRKDDKDIQTIKSSHKIKKMFFEEYKNNFQNSQQDGMQKNGSNLFLKGIRVTKIASNVFYENISFWNVNFVGVTLENVEAGEISKEDYDKWRYHYPEFDKAQNYVKVPPQDLF